MTLANLLGLNIWSHYADHIYMYVYIYISSWVHIFDTLLICGINSSNLVVKMTVVLKMLIQKYSYAAVACAVIWGGGY